MMDLTEFRSCPKSKGLGGLPPGRRRVGELRDGPPQSGRGCDSQATERLTSLAIMPHCRYATLQQILNPKLGP